MDSTGAEQVTKKLHILQHALGLDQYGRGQMYRAYFVTGPGSTDYDACVSLVADGLMVERPASALSGGSPVFLVTEAGKRYVIEHSPPPPKLTRSQKRYEAWLDADCGLTFGEFLRSTPRL